MNVYPNPASQTVQFKVDGNNREDVMIRVTDALGKEVKRLQVPEHNGVLRMDVSQLNPGVYFYSLTISGKAVSTRRLLVTR